MGRLAIVRLEWRNQFGAMWLSDYIDNNLKEPELEISEENFRSYLEIQKSAVINMMDVKRGCEFSGLDRETWLGIQNNYKKLRQTYPDTYEEVMDKKINI